MQKPRIYTYKITFEEVPYWYWGVHKEKKFGELYYGSSKTHKWMWEFYTPKIQILEFFPNTKEGWSEARKVESRLIAPDLNAPLCLNENNGGSFSLTAVLKGSAAAHAEKDEFGRSVTAVKASTRAMELGVGITSQSIEKLRENGRKGAKSLLVSMTPEQRTEKARKAGNASAASRTPEQNLEYGRKAAAAAHAEKDENGNSKNAVKAGRKGAAKTNSQIWQSTVDGFTGNAGNVAQHNKALGEDPNARIKISG